jgi:hypothetical protein
MHVVSGSAIRKHGDQEDMKENTYVGMESKWYDAFHIKRNTYISMDTLNVSEKSQMLYIELQ